MQPAVLRRSLILSLALMALTAATTRAASPETTPPKGAQTQNTQAAPAANVTRLGGAQGWDAYLNDVKTGKVCYVVGKPSKSEPDSVKRTAVYVSVTHRPAEKTANEVSFNAGYPFKDGSDADLDVDGHKFSLFTNKESAWSRDAAADKAVVAALAKGKQAIIKGTSARGTATTDTYSLAGFAQALAEIDKACGVKR